MSRLAPQVVFEIASEETWRNDLEKKPGKYGQMGIDEYFFYDPDDTPHWRCTQRRLYGWQRNAVSGEMTEMLPEGQGRLWSDHLASFLVPDGMYLRLYDSNMQRRLTEAEALIQKLRSMGVNPDEL